jgi:hypothetical protein
MPADTSLEKAIADAAEEIKTGKKPAADEQSPEVVVEVAAEETPGGEEAQEPTAEEIEAAEAIEAKNLYRALKNPATSRAVIAALTEQLGMNKAPAETKAEEKRQVKDVKSILGEALGEYKFLADKLGPAIEQILESERESNETRFAAQEQYRIEQEVVAATAELNRVTKGESSKLEARMNELSQEIPVGTQSVKTYINRLYTIAAGERQKIEPRRIADKVRANANDPTARLQGTRGPDTKIEIPNGKMNINQAVKFAFDQLAGKKG